MESNITLEQIQNFKGKYPKQLWYLFFSEMWERFCFYGMRGMLVVFMVSHLGMNEKVANLQYGATQAWVYAFTFIGGLFADKILGLRKSLFWGGILMIIGSVILAIDPKNFFFIGLGFTIVGTGFFKPNISSMVGQLYPDGDPRRDAGFSFFYMGVNLGALIGGYICIAVAEGSMWQSIVPEHLRWNVGFGFAAIVMIISLLMQINNDKENALILVSEYSKLSTIGQSMVNISHQWKEPINHIYYAVNNIIAAKEFNDPNLSNIIDDSVNQIKDTTKYMTNTAKNFLSIYEDKTIIKNIEITKSIELIIEILKKEISEMNVKIKINSNYNNFILIL